MKAHFQYAYYLARHKWFVFVAGRTLGVPLWRLIIHDWSKFLPSEWEPYARYFYATPPGAPSVEWDKALNDFNRAWLHHQHWNPHHWQFWVVNMDDGGHEALEMPYHFMLEMVADWMGAGRAITGKWDVKAWYLRTRSNMVLHPTTERRVENLLGVRPWGG